MRQIQTIECAIKKVEKQGPSGPIGPEGQGVAPTGSTGSTGPQGHTGPPDLNTSGMNYIKTYTEKLIPSQGTHTFQPTLPPTFPEGVYLVICNMQITPVNVNQLSSVSISYTGLLSNTYDSDYTKVTELNG